MTWPDARNEPEAVRVLTDHDVQEVERSIEEDEEIASKIEVSTQRPGKLESLI